MSDTLKRYVLHVPEFPDEPFMAEHQNGAWIDHRDHREIVKGFERDIAALQSDIEAQIAIAREAVGRAAGLERDAERYRWLKSRTRCFSLDMGGRHRYDPSSAFMRLQGPTLDDAFDAAIEKEKA